MGKARRRAEEKWGLRKDLKENGGENGGLGSGSGLGSDSGYGEHDPECEALFFLKVFVGRHLLTQDEAREIVKRLKMRPEMRDSSVPMWQRMCACGGRSLLRAGAREQMVRIWGENFGHLVGMVVGPEETGRRSARIKELLREFDEIVDD